MNCLRRFSFYQCLAISLLLHVSLALPFLLGALHIPDHSRHEQLRIELFGMISDRQLEERHQGTAEPQQEERAVQEVKRTVPRPIPEKYQTAESPAQVEKAEDNPNEPVAVPVVANTAGVAEEQKQQSIRYESQADILQAYMARVTKQIQGNLVYPKEVRENGVKGVSTIAFTITSSGNIRENSLRVQKSSGHAALDASAIRSARDSAPFEKPPKELDIAIAVSFDDGRL